MSRSATATFALALAFVSFSSSLARADVAPAPLVVPSDGGEPWTADRIASLDRDLDALIANAPTLRGAHLAALVQTTDGRTLYAHDADDAIQPASTMKLLTGASALDRLGAAFAFRTTLAVVPAPPGGVPTLVLTGGGDPLLRDADLADAADAASRAGVGARVALLIDESAVSGEVRKGDGWEIDDILWPWAPVVNGLPFDENVLAGTLAPGAAAGAPPILRLAPPFVPALADPATCPGGPTATTFTVRARTVAAGVPESVGWAPGRCGDVVLTGDVPLGDPVKLRLAVDAPELLARAAFADALGRRGIAVVDPGPGTLAQPLAGVTDLPHRPAPGETVVWAHDGEPLAALLRDFWFPSDNLVGEELLYAQDAARGQRPATADGAVAAETAWLRSIGVDPAAVEIADGSGLSQYDRLSPRVQATIVRHLWEGPNRAAVLAALPVLGVRGDIGSFGAGSPAAGRVFAKGGSMSHIRGMAGFVATATRGTAVVALDVDDWLGASDDDLDAFRAAFCARIARE